MKSGHVPSFALTVEVATNFKTQVGWHISGVYVRTSLDAQSVTQKPRKHVVVNEHELAFSARVGFVLGDQLLCTRAIKRAYIK